jgi:hypothetical protein
MAQQDLDSRPGQVYDPETDGAKPHPESLEKRNSPADEAAFDQIAAGNRDIESAERNASPIDGQSPSTNNKESTIYSAKDTVGKGFDNKPTIKGRFSKGQKFGIGFGSAGLVGLLILGVVTLQGPFQLLNFSKFLQSAHFFENEDMGDERTSNVTLLYRYRNTGTIQGTRIGAIQGKYADKWDQRMLETSGLRPVYDNNPPGRMVGFEVVDEDKARSVLDDLENDGIDTNSTREGVNTGRSGGVPEGRIISMRDANSKKRRAAIRTVVRSVDLNKVSSTIGSRTLIKLGGVDFHPIKNLERRAGESITDFYQRKKDQREERIKAGQDDVDLKRLDADGGTDANGDPIAPDQSVVDDVANSNAIAEEATDALDGGTLDLLKKALQSRLTSAATGAAAVVGAMCVVRDLGDQAETLQFTQTIMPMMRMGFEFLSIGSQLQSGQDLSIEEIGYYSSLLNDENAEVGKSYVEAASIQYEKGLDPTGPDVESAVKPNRVSNKPMLFSALDEIPLLSNVCGIQKGISDTIGRIPIVGSVVNKIGEVSQGAIDLALKNTLGLTTEDLVSSVVSWLAGEAVNLAAEGAQLGNYVNYGARLAANSASLVTGGREISEIESSVLEDEKIKILAYENTNKSVFERYLDIHNERSLISTAYLSKPKNLNNIFMASLRTPLTLASRLSGSTSAQSSDFDYGFDKVSFSASERSNELVADPIANAEVVKPKLAEMQTKYGDCFPITVDPATESITVDSFNDPNVVSQFSTPAECNVPGEQNPELLQYRMHLNDLSTAVSLDCYESGEPQACGEMGFNSVVGETATVSATSGGAAIEIPLGGYKLSTIQTDTTAQSCTGGLRPGAREVAEFVKLKWGKSYGGYDCRGKSTNASSLSIHSEGRAIDQSYNAFSVTDLQAGNETFGWLLSNAETIGIQYVKFWKLQWSPTRGLSCVTSQSDIATHSNHIHYELNIPASERQTSWFTNRTDYTPFIINQGLCQ